ncbi:hypothetical protein C2U54_20020 [Leclercia sp. LSNIH1]|nr:hypothetical protein C2U54_20020 [Leclercia sp. LSNIH1]POV36452.1 hypothetical protein C3388_04040 [Leclercia sp. LSNIH5]POW68604.1 hypothetical protein C3389_02405 [Leclercia sp. LSNIH2]
MVPGTASIYGLCFSALAIIPSSNAAVCDRILRIISYQKITRFHYLTCGAWVFSPLKLRISNA